MEDKLVQELMNRLDVVAAKMGEKAGFFYGLAVRQVYVNFFVDVLTLVFLVSMLLLAIKLWMKDANATESPQEEMGIVFGIMALLLGITISIAFFATAMDFGYVLNPQYGALKLMLKMVGK